MSLENFITDLLNIKPEDLQEIYHLKHFGGTSLIKINLLKDLKSPEATYTNVVLKYNYSVTKVIRVFDKHIDIPRKKLPIILSIDKHSFPESDYDSLYYCLSMDFATGEILDILPDRKKSYLIQYFSMIKHDTLNFTTNMSELDNVKFVSIDMYENFRDISRIYFPNAKVCTDSFHVLKRLTDDFRKVRIRCQNSTENTTLKYLLIKFRRAFDHKYQELLDNEP